MFEGFTVPNRDILAHEAFSSLLNSKNWCAKLWLKCQVKLEAKKRALGLHLNLDLSA